MDLRPSRSTRFLPIVLMLVIGLAVVGLVMLAAPATQASPVSAPQATPTPGVNYELGTRCMKEFGGNSCTANDVKIASLSPSASEACLSALPNETATVIFKAEILSTATDRYDVGFFIATEGGSAFDGGACYHDFLQPVSTGVTPNPPLNLIGGYGPFRQIDGIPADQCGDVRQNDGSNFYFTQVPVTIRCVDTDNDGVVDPISTCIGWDNNENTLCTNVQQAGAGTGSKCRCESQASGVLIYRGLDYGDLPNTYKTLQVDSGPSHAVQDLDGNGTPDTIGGIPAVWLGTKIDLETNGQPTTAADGDDLAGVVPDDEDGVTPTLNSWTVGNPGNASVTVVVSTSTGNCAGCKLAWWMDWNNDGDFDDSGENYSAAVTANSNSLNFAVPSYVTNFNFSVYSRWRLYSPQAVIAYPTPSYTALVTNGEVEDYLWNLQPLGVTLASFSAMCSGGQPEISWETVSELNTLGFNVWRNTSNSGPQDKLNDTMIPAHPGSAQGYTYAFTDTTAQVNTTYYYWLEDIDTGNVSTFHGPIEAQCQSPTSVGLDTVDANPVAGLPVAALPTAGLLALGAVGATAAWLRRRRA